MIQELVLEKRTGLGDYGYGIALQPSNDKKGEEPTKKKGKLSNTANSMTKSQIIKHGH